MTKIKIGLWYMQLIGAVCGETVLVEELDRPGDPLLMTLVGFDDTGIAVNYGGEALHFAYDDLLSVVVW